MFDGYIRKSNTDDKLLWKHHLHSKYKLRLYTNDERIPQLIAEYDTVYGYSNYHDIADAIEKTLSFITTEKYEIWIKLEN